MAHSSKSPNQDSTATTTPASTDRDHAADATEARLESLEFKLMDMEIAVQQLNDVILRQFQDIERLQLAHEVLQERLDTSSGGDNTSAENEVPPHY